MGSVEEIQAKLFKRQEAAAKRERAMAYALAHQWQAGSRQQAASSGFEPDKSSWGWNWLERWMAVRPWENRFLDINLKDGVIICENGALEGKNGTRSQLRSDSKKSVPSNIHPNLASPKTGPPLSYGCDSSPSKSAGLLEASKTQFVKPKSNGNVDTPTEEANSKPVVGSRSHSNPKEGTTRGDKPAKERLSLPNNGAQTARNASRTNAKLRTQKPSRDKPKLNGKGNVNPVESVPQPKDMSEKSS